MNVGKKIEGAGPWKSKSGGELNVVNRIPLSLLKQLGFFDYNEEELGKLPSEFDIRGLRTYTVRGIPAGTIGGTEFHRIRGEFLHCLEGEVEFVLESLVGEIEKHTLSPSVGVFVPPYTLHRYTATKECSGLLVICNTLFLPEDSRTHDTYPEDEFRKLQTKSVSI